MKELFDRLNIKPKNLELYTTAFSHSSYVNENHIKSDYERLEFLGDAVLELVASDYLYKTKTINEGEMTKLRASYVCENACYEYSKDLNSKYKILATELKSYTITKSVDTRIYDNKRLFREPNSINRKTGYYKVQLTLNDLKAMSYEDLIKYASKPRDLLEVDNVNSIRLRTEPNSNNQGFNTYKYLVQF